MSLMPVYERKLALYGNIEVDNSVANIQQMQKFENATAFTQKRLARVVKSVFSQPSVFPQPTRWVVEFEE